MIRYINIMYQEMKLWAATPACKFKGHGKDQAIHNYLFKMGAFDELNLQVFFPRQGLVNTVGIMGTKLETRLYEQSYGFNSTTSSSSKKSDIMNKLRGTTDKTWIGDQFELTDHRGYFIDYDGQRSRVIHQWDRFGNAVQDWAYKNILDEDK